MDPLPRDRWSLARCSGNNADSHHRILPLGSIGVTIRHANRSLEQKSEKDKQQKVLSLTKDPTRPILYLVYLTNKLKDDL